MYDTLITVYHGSSAKLVQYTGVSSPHSNVKVTDILKEDFHCYVTINMKAFPPFHPRINSTKTCIN